VALDETTLIERCQMTRRCLLFTLLVSACASSNPQPTLVTVGPPLPGATAVVCDWETPVGSNIRIQRCRREEDINIDRREAQQFLSTPRVQPMMK